jgi:hypothetical protein
MDWELNFILINKDMRDMKKKVILFLMVAIATGGCKKALKDVNDYFPKVTTVSAIVQNDGSLLVTGNITSQGDDAVKHCGMSLSTSSSPALNDRQLVASVGTTFSCSYAALSPDSVYYIRAWAANRYGYAMGNILTVDSVKVGHVTPPCTLTANTANLGTGTGTASVSSGNAISYDSFSGYYSFTAYLPSSDAITFMFGSHVANGIFTSAATAYPTARQVVVTYFNSPTSTTYHVNDGASVYINTVNTGVYDITLCDGPWSNGVNTYHLSGRFSAHD